LTVVLGSYPDLCRSGAWVLPKRVHARNEPH